LAHAKFKSAVRITSVALFWTSTWFVSASAKEISFEIVISGEAVGAVTIFTNLPAEFPGEEGLRGAFGILKEGADGNTFSLMELEQYLGQDHLNWFQKVISITPPLSGVPAPFIDPPRGGMPGVWADTLPWYFDETLPPPGTPYNPNRQLQQQGDPAGSTLNYFDTPHAQPPGTSLDFVTFLISDYGDKTYVPLGGFSWTSEIQPNGHAVITALASAAFKQEYADEIKADFGFMLVPQPSTFTLMLSAMTMAAVVGWIARCRKRRGT